MNAAYPICSQCKRRYKRTSGHKCETSQIKEVVTKTKYELIQDAISECNGNKSKAAKLLNIDRKTLYNIVKEYESMFKTEESINDLKENENGIS
jgi:DNA-binding NtrC family response regulator